MKVIKIFSTVCSVGIVEMMCFECLLYSLANHESGSGSIGGNRTVETKEE